MSKKPHISVVTPVYGCAKALPELYERLKSALLDITNDFEILMINDDSPDEAWHVIETLAKEDDRVRGINLSRNFGQHQAISAGLNYVRGEWVVVMDCDLQDLPEEIKKFYEEAQKGNDMVVGKRDNRQDPSYRKILSHLFFRTIRYLSGMSISGNTGNFGIYSRNVINHISNLREHGSSFGMKAIWLGFKRKEILIDHGKRSYGNSGYTIKAMLNMALSHILLYSDKFLKLTVKFGFLLSFISFVASVSIILRYYLWGGAGVTGWNSLIVTVLFMSGLIILSVGVTGLYIGSIFEEVKRRPNYVVKSETWEDS